MHRKGFTLIELLVVFAVISLLSAILFPVFARAREQGRKVVCQSNLKQIGVALSMYAQDYDGFYPDNGDPYLWMGRRWRWLVQPYLGQSLRRDPGEPDNPYKSQGVPGILACPSDETAPLSFDSTSYGYSCAFYHTPEQINAMSTAHLWQTFPGGYPFPCVSQSQSQVAYPAQKAVAAEWLSNHDALRIGWWDWREGRNYLFADGHVKYLRASGIRRAVSGFPDINLTRDGIAGRDIPADEGG
ncbi:MAG: type II secretion system protein [Armatimonadetes bacterium]|nr:type II secretion system protein [Armatimonadota bacterium]